MENQGRSNRNDAFEPSALQISADVEKKNPEEKQDPTETELCQQLTDTLSISSELTHTLTPIPSLTDRTISISRNTNSLTRFSEDEDTENIDGNNVKLTNWTTRSFCTSTEDMISSGIFDSDIEASGNEGTIESLPRESISTNEDSAYKWHDISASDIWDEDDATLVPYNRKPRIIVESSSEDEPRKLRKPLTFFNIRKSEASDNSYPHSSNRTYSNLDDFQGSSTLTSEGLCSN
ncbi:uncharacterized protein LOC123321697 [Coccinella septempunctata]|uniref:uncharacterized protein LOC123321697 n=1 Tax=Coccinella septempunctata TaxID=41139 RepID=UPI001D069A1C|nr:uncharacterized protein LOC123321697 [Coccinella septempunctata]